MRERNVCRLLSQVIILHEPEVGLIYPVISLEVLLGYPDGQLGVDVVLVHVLARDELCDPLYLLTRVDAPTGRGGERHPGCRVTKSLVTVLHFRNKSLGLLDSLKIYEERVDLCSILHHFPAVFLVC